MLFVDRNNLFRLLYSLRQSWSTGGSWATSLPHPATTALIALEPIVSSLPWPTLNAVVGEEGG